MMTLEQVTNNVEEAQKVLQERTSQLQQADPVFQNMVGQFNAWKTMKDSLEAAQAPSNGQPPQGGPTPPSGQNRPQSAPQEA